MKKRGKFIVIEGCYGAGKDSSVEYLKERFRDRDDILFTQEPGGTPIAEEIRELLLKRDTENRKGERMDPLTEIFLFCAARTQHTATIKPVIDSGKHVICVRFDWSTIAYQIFGRERYNLKGIFKQLNSVAKNDVEPDLIIYLDVDPEIGLARKRASKKGLCTRFDEEKLEFHNRVRQGYLTQLIDEETSKKYEIRASKCYLVDANNQESVVKKRVCDIVEMIMQKN